MAILNYRFWESRFGKREDVVGSIVQINGAPATAGNGGTVGFTVADSAGVDAWHAAGIANGGTTCEDPPGVRESGMGKMYLAYLRDPSGNKLCALHRMG